MGIFNDLFSTKPAEEAAAAKKAGLQQGYDALSGAYGQGRDQFSTDLGYGRDALRSDLASGRGALSTDLASGRGALTSNIDAGNSAIRSGYGAGRDAIKAGYDDASALYRPLLASTSAGANAYGDATGANGAEGIARGGSTFKSLPGYSGGLTTGIDAVDRGAAARGALGGGNTSADIIKFASDYDANKYGSYVSSLAPYLGLNANAVSGAAGLDTARAGALASSYAGEGGAVNGNFGTLGTGLNASFGAEGAGRNASYGAEGAGINASYGAEGAGRNASFMSQGGAANANYSGQGQADADAKQAAYGASQNFWSALMGGANLLGKATGVGGFGAGAKKAA